MADLDRRTHIVSSGENVTGDDLEFCLALANDTDAEKRAIVACEFQ
jgi:hypothetical protein